MKLDIKKWDTTRIIITSDGGDHCCMYKKNIDGSYTYDHQISDGDIPDEYFDAVCHLIEVN